jgi:hypothetical protein
MRVVDLIYERTDRATNTRADEVDDEAAVGGAVEEGLAVGQPRDGPRRGGVADEVARVGQRVAEREETGVAAAGTAFRPCRRRNSRRGGSHSRAAASAVPRRYMELASRPRRPAAVCFPQPSWMQKLPGGCV